MDHSLILLLTSPRVGPGLLSRDAWKALEDARAVWALEGESQALAIEEAGVEVAFRPEEAPELLGRALVEACAEGDVVWVGSSDGDPGLNDAIASEVTRLSDPPDVEVLVGSHDVPGARLLDVVAVMDRLRSPGGCPWDAQQTHQSLVPYLLEEAYEAIEALETGDPGHMQEELGDLLLQIVFHARVAQDDPEVPFDIDDVAGGLVEKLVRRHPHVFSDVDATTAEAVEANWHTIKAAEKAHRVHPLEGVPEALPALARAEKFVGRLEKAELTQPLEDALASPGLGADLLALVRRGRAEGKDAEAALRDTLRGLVAAVSVEDLTEQAHEPTGPGGTGQ
jgi:XTP/dITP diphosphohydrolase